MTRFAPACQHWRTTSATSSGLVLAACSGVRSHAMLGLMTTTSWRPMKREMPPRSARARCTSARGSPPLTTLMLRQLRIVDGSMIATCLLRLLGNGTRTALAEPISASRRNRGDAAGAQQMQHRIPPRQALRRSGFSSGLIYLRHSIFLESIDRSLSDLQQVISAGRWCRAHGRHRRR